MLEETLTRLRTHRRNIQRYCQLLETKLTDSERDYIGKRLSEEQTAIAALSADTPRVTPSQSPAVHQPTFPPSSSSELLT
jgi:hypothetical protein